MNDPKSGISRRTLLLQLLGLGGVAAAGQAMAQSAFHLRPWRSGGISTAGSALRMPFEPLRGPIPLPSDGLSGVEQRQA